MATVTTLIPIQEMTPGQVGKIRNDVINHVVGVAARELKKGVADLVVRDIRPFHDLDLYRAGTTAWTVDHWEYEATTTTADAFTTVTGTQTMDDNKFIALFGVRDLRGGLGIHCTTMSAIDATTSASEGLFDKRPVPPQLVSFIKINVGGADKVIWDLTSMEAYSDSMVGFAPAAVIIPQNVSYNIGYYFMTTAAGIVAYLQLIGVVVEPRGLTISP